MMSGASRYASEIAVESQADLQESLPVPSDQIGGHSLQQMSARESK